MLWNGGSGATINGKSFSSPDGDASFERFLLGCCQALENEENALTRENSRPATNDSISVSLNLSSLLATISIRFTTDLSGQLMSCSHYLMGSLWESGTGATYTAPNLVDAIFQGCLVLKNTEYNSTKNPESKDSISYSLSPSGEGKLGFEASLRIPIITIPLPSGGIVVEAKNWLV